MIDKIKKYVDAYPKNNKGKIVMWQFPNALLWTWIFTMLLARFLHGGRLDKTAEVVAFGSLFTWAYLEITKGDSYFRRTVGLIVIIVTIISRSA